MGTVPMDQRKKGFEVSETKSVPEKLLGSLHGLLSHQLSGKNAKNKNPVDNLYAKLVALLKEKTDDFQKLYNSIKNAVDNAKIKDNLAKKIIKKANVLVQA